MGQSREWADNSRSRQRYNIWMKHKKISHISALSALLKIREVFLAIKTTFFSSMEPMLWSRQNRLRDDSNEWSHHMIFWINIQPVVGHVVNTPLFCSFVKHDNVKLLFTKFHLWRLNETSLAYILLILEPNLTRQSCVWIISTILCK